MASRIIQPERILALNRKEKQSGRYVLYWMQQSQRAECNHALEYAIQQANEAGKPLVVAFGLMDDYAEANARHYHFMLQGLAETQRVLEGRNVTMVVRHGHPAEVAVELSADAVMVVCDRGYLRHQKVWREQVAELAPCHAVEVETDVVVPVETTSEKAEYAARTIRPRIHRHLEEYLIELATTAVDHASLELTLKGGLNLSDTDALLATLNLDRSVGPVPLFFEGGTNAAKRRLKDFLDTRFADYTAHRNHPEHDNISCMSPYLHFGQISPLYLALRIRAAAEKGTENIDAYLEELIVRRELACNYVHYTDNYDSFEAVPGWARATLNKHRDDPREHVYTKAQLVAAETHDRYWNAAMNEMKHTGFMHNYMRMYWGKKILEWSRTPEHAYRTVLELNNTYFLDGRDPNSYANVGWIFGLHDRPWKERSVFGTVRYMNARGLERKCDIQGYADKVQGFMGGG